MAYTLIGQNDAISTGTLNGAVTYTVTAGSLLVLCAVTRNGTVLVTSVTDSQSQTWTSAHTGQTSGGYCYIYYCQNSYTGSLTVTANGTGTTDTHYDNISEWTGQNTGTVLAGHDGGLTTPTATQHYHCPTGVNATSGQLMVGVAIQASTISDEAYNSSLFTPLQFTNSTNLRQWWGYRIATGTESGERGAWTQTSGLSAGILALFDLAAASSSAPRCLHQLKQQGIA